MISCSPGGNKQYGQGVWSVNKVGQHYNNYHIVRDILYTISIHPTSKFPALHSPARALEKDVRAYGCILYSSLLYILPTVLLKFSQPDSPNGPHLRIWYSFMKTESANRATPGAILSFARFLYKLISADDNSSLTNNDNGGRNEYQASDSQFKQTKAAGSSWLKWISLCLVEKPEKVV